MTYDERAHTILCGILGTKPSQEQTDEVLKAYGDAEAFARDVAECVREKVRVVAVNADRASAEERAYYFAAKLLPEPAA